MARADDIVAAGFACDDLDGLEARLLGIGATAEWASDRFAKERGADRLLRTQDPTGLDLDLFGRLYFTEIPTPGVDGNSGGSNRVSRYNPRNGETIVISEGEPEPFDVTTDLFGKNVYWTCKTAGVIIRATKQ